MVFPRIPRGINACVCIYILSSRPLSRDSPEIVDQNKSKHAAAWSRVRIITRRFMKETGQIKTGPCLRNEDNNNRYGRCCRRQPEGRLEIRMQVSQSLLLKVCDLPLFQGTRAPPNGPPPRNQCFFRIYGLGFVCRLSHLGCLLSLFFFSFRALVDIRCARKTKNVYTSRQPAA